MVTVTLKRKTTGSKGGGGGRSEPLPEGKYRVKTSNPRMGSEVFKDNYGDVVLTLTVQQGDYANRELDVRIFPNSEALRSLVESMGGDSEAEEADLDFDGLEGLELNAYVGIKPGKKGGEFNIVKRFAPAPQVKR